METEGRLRLADVFVSITDPRQAGKVEHDLVELLVVAVNAVLVGADTFVEIELWAKEKLDWLRRYVRLEHGVPSHDTFGRLFGLIDPEEFEAAFRRWVGAILPALGPQAVVAIDGKTSRRSGKVGATPLHRVSAFAAGAGLVLGQRATAEKSNEKTAIPELLATLALEGCINAIRDGPRYSPPRPANVGTWPGTACHEVNMATPLPGATRRKRALTNSTNRLAGPPHLA